MSAELAAACRQSARSQAARARHLLVAEKLRDLGLGALFTPVIRDAAIARALAAVAPAHDPSTPIGSALARAADAPASFCQFLRRSKTARAATSAKGAALNSTKTPKHQCEDYLNHP